MIAVNTNNHCFFQLKQTHNVTLAMQVLSSKCKLPSLNPLTAKTSRKPSHTHARVSTSPRRDNFVLHCSKCLWKRLTNQNAPTAHIFLGLRGVWTQKGFCRPKNIRFQLSWRATRFRLKYSRRQFRVFRSKTQLFETVNRKRNF